MGTFFTLYITPNLYYPEFDLQSFSTPQFHPVLFLKKYTLKRKIVQAGKKDEESNTLVISHHQEETKDEVVAQDRDVEKNEEKSARTPSELEKSKVQVTESSNSIPSPSGNLGEQG